jgi:shikimate dehydrogenase
MKKFALIGKNIKHSLSPDIYKNLLKDRHEYILIDASGNESLPTLEELRNEYVGVNITTPYKEHYFDRKFCVHVPASLSAINCISFRDDSIKMTNTDFIAMKKILNKRFFSAYRLKCIYILGSGVMAKLTQSLLTEMNRSFQVVSRSRSMDINLFDFSHGSTESNSYTLLINCCSREFYFEGKVERNTLFWDLNYEMPHKDVISRQCTYFDGKELLMEQAIEAARFWGELC